MSQERPLILDMLGQWGQELIDTYVGPMNKLELAIALQRRLENALLGRTVDDTSKSVAVKILTEFCTEHGLRVKNCCPKFFKLYLASSVENRVMLPTVEWHLLRALPDWKIIGDWYNQPPVPDNGERAALDFGAIQEADALVAVYPYGYGTVSEMAFALGRGKPVIYIRPEYEQYADEDPLIAGLPAVKVVSSWDQVCAVLDQWSEEQLGLKRTWLVANEPT